jgi:hypothetical protein
MATSTSDTSIRPPPTRNIGLNERLAPVRPTSAATAHSESSDDEDEPSKQALIDDLPDATYASRRAPELSPPRGISSKSAVNSVTVHGDLVVAGGSHHVRVYNCTSGEQILGLALAGEPKITAVTFRASHTGAEDANRYIWVGCKDGTLVEVDVHERTSIEVRTTAHSHPILGIYRIGQSMLSLDEGGKLQIWTGDPPSLAPQAASKTQRIDKSPFAVVLNDQLWTASFVHRAGGVAGSSRAPLIRVYAPLATDAAFSLTSRPIAPPDTAGPVGAVTAASTLQSIAERVYVGHESGHVSIWSSTDFTCVDVLRISNYQVTALCGVGTLLWAGYRTGTIYVYDVTTRPWKVVKAWKAHKEAVATIFVDDSSLWTVRGLVCALVCGELDIAHAVGLAACHLGWDRPASPLLGWLPPHRLVRCVAGRGPRRAVNENHRTAMQLAKRDADFCTYRSLRLLLCTWNVDAAKPAELAADVIGTDFLPEVLRSVDAPDVVVFGFQELVDLEDKKLTASASRLALVLVRSRADRRTESLLLGRAKKDAKLSEVISGQYRLWHDKLVQAVRLAMPVDCPYALVHVENLVGVRSWPVRASSYVTPGTALQLRLRQAD